jgi:hypothetical protein
MKLEPVTLEGGHFEGRQILPWYGAEQILMVTIERGVHWAHAYDSEDGKFIERRKLYE